MATRRRTQFVPSVPSRPTVDIQPNPPGSVETGRDTNGMLDTLPFRSEPENIAELKKATISKIYAANGYEVDDSWFDTRGDLKPGKRLQIELLPTVEQIFGTTIRQSATDVEGLTDERTGSSRQPSVLNNPLLHYAGPRSVSMVTIALASGGALSVALRAFSLTILNLISVSDAAGSFARSALNLPDTDFRLNECFEEGLPQVLGFDLSFGVSLDTARRSPIFTAPGFYSSLSRRVVGDVANIGRAFGNINSPLTVVEALANLRDSLTFGIVRVAVALGNALLLRKRGRTFKNPDTMPLPGRDSYGFRGLYAIDRVGRSRLEDGRRLSTSLRDLPSAFLPPATVRNRLSMASVEDKFQSSLLDRNEGNEAMLNALQRELEKEYVPFWIQDMRTGEVAAFHAFLDSFTDSFSTSLEQTATSGRMDDVLSLNKTTRTVSVDFFLVATHPDEHDYLWWIVNWLTTLVYPQWSEGIEVGEGRTSPFGRVPTASPLVRIRLADLWRSNAGSESLSRLLLSESVLREAQRVDIEGEFNGQTLLRNLGNPTNLSAGQDYRLFPGTYKIRSGGSLGSAFQRFGAQIRSAFSVGGANEPDVLKLYETAAFQYSGTEDGKPYGRLGSLDEGSFVDGGITVFVEPADLQEFSTVELTGAERTLIAQTGTPAQSGTPPIQARSPLEDSLFAQALRKGALDGLAGMISSFEVDYNWQQGFGLEATPGSRAPIGVKITLSMQVIHDIQPGKDSLGNNRAPIYPVGAPSRDSVGDFRPGAARTATARTNRNIGSESDEGQTSSDSNQTNLANERLRRRRR